MLLLGGRNCLCFLSVATFFLLRDSFCYLGRGVRMAGGLLQGSFTGGADFPVFREKEEFVALLECLTDVILVRTALLTQ